MMTQPDFIRQEIEVLNQRQQDCLKQIHQISLERNEILEIMAAKERELKRFEKWEKKQRREAYDRDTKTAFITAQCRV
jgi:hypothetical protein